MNDSQQGSRSSGGDDAARSTQSDGPGSEFEEIYEGIPGWIKAAVALGAIVIIAVIFGLWHTFYFHWFQVHTGTINETGPYYGFWSGFGSDLGEGTIVVAIAATWRHHNCHVKGCARLGRRVDGTPYLACPKHHPEHKGYKRGVSLEELHVAHKEAKH